MPAVDNYAIVQIISLAATGMSHRQISDRLGIVKSTITFILQKWVNEHSIERRQGSARPRISTPEDDRALVEVVQNVPFATAIHAVQASNFPGAIRTARRRIRRGGLRCRVAARKTRLLASHREARIGYSLQYIAEDANFWSKVVFSDEKMFQSSRNGRIRVYRPPDTRYDEPYVSTTENTGRFSVNMWAWISAESPGIMVHIEDRLTSPVYISLLENLLLPSVRRVYENNNFIYQQDNCPIHTANGVKAWFQARNTQMMDWPSRSPDLNPIENMWGLLVRKIQERRLVFQNKNELLAAINDGWNALPHNYHRNLCLSMTRRLTKVLDVNGAYTKY